MRLLRLLILGSRTDEPGSFRCQCSVGREEERWSESCHGFLCVQSNPHRSLWSLTDAAPFRRLRWCAFSLHCSRLQADDLLAVGSGQSGTKTLEKTKQWWYLVKHVGEVGKRSRVFEESFVDERALTEMYYIIAHDHISDQSPKAVTGASLMTAGGYKSTVLGVWNKVRSGLSSCLRCRC